MAQNKHKLREHNFVFPFENFQLVLRKSEFSSSKKKSFVIKS